jgi:hypothetical protein
MVHSAEPLIVEHAAAAATRALEIFHTSIGDIFSSPHPLPPKFATRSISNTLKGVTVMAVVLGAKKHLQTTRLRVVTVVCVQIAKMTTQPNHPVLSRPKSRIWPMKR